MKKSKRFLVHLLLLGSSWGLPIGLAAYGPYLAAPNDARDPAGRSFNDERTISGQITDEAGEAVIGATVVLKGTTTGAITDVDGRFSLRVPDEGGTLMVSLTGYETLEVPIGDQTTLTIRLAEAKTLMSEVLVTGYQSQQRGDIISSIGVVNTEDMKKTQAATLGEMLSGRVAGVNVVSSGAPGQSSSVKIRGTNSLLGQDNPLYVIDGMFINGVDADFNPNDIETVQVLKDAAATAMYGSRGMNGVIVITTKKGRKGEPKINYNVYAGVQNVPKRLPLANAAQFRAIADQAYINNGEPVRNFNQDVDTDWQDALFQQGRTMEHNLSFSGGTDNAAYLISGNYYDQTGTIIGPEFKRYQLRVNSEMTRGILRIGENLALSTADQTRINGLPFIDVLRMLPTIPVNDSSTNSGFGYGNDDNPTFGTNPVALQQHYNNTGHTNKVFGSIFAELSIFKFLMYKLNLGLDYATVRSRYFERAGRIRQNNPDLGPAFVNHETDEFFNTLAENTLNYNQVFGVHELNALVGYTTQRDQRTNLFAHTEGIDGEFWVQNAGTSSPRTQGFTDVAGLRSWLGSVNYSFADRYLVQLNVRRDGSSRFGKDNRWANFPSASVGWRISNEPFMENSRKISDLKLRVSYGTVGNQAIPNYATAAVIANNLNYPFGGAVQAGAANRRLVNENLRWESKTTTNVGLDLGLLDNRVIFNADYFISETKDLLVEVPVPLSSGNNGPNPYDNLASIQNKGVELALTYQNSTPGGFQYRATGNFTAVKNEVLELIPANGNLPIFGYNQLTRTAIGSSVGAYWGLVSDGIFQNQAEIDASAQINAIPGDIRFIDTDGNGLIDFEDRQELGSPFPDFEYGLNLGAGYMGLDMSIFFQGVAGNMLYNEGNWWLGRYDDLGNYRTDVTFWTGPGTSTTVPLPRHGDPSRNPVQQSDRWLEKGDYFRLKSLQIGYTLPTGLLSKTRALSTARIYFTGLNLFTITDYTGYDPEIIGASPSAGSGRDSWFGRGVDAGNYPVSKSYSIGLQVGF